MREVLRMKLLEWDIVRELELIFRVKRKEK